jgi:hypothetical protein
VLDLLPSYEYSAAEQRDVPVIVDDELSGLRVELNSGGEEQILRFRVPGCVPPSAAGTARTVGGARCR